MYSRTINLLQFHNSLFLFGPRQVGKTFLINNTLSPDFFINLLEQKVYLRYAKDVSLFSKEVRALNRKKCLIVIDEIQRCPELLNEVQLLMGELPEAQFILTGSSARKLKRAGVNMLGGRAYTVHLHPLTFQELGKNFSLDQILMYGSIPSVVLKKDVESKIRLLRSYIETYLKEEIQQEALTRNIPAFARFLELASFENGKILNFQAIAREVGVNSKTIKEYFYILEDTLLGFLFSPYTKSHRKKLVLHPKFYFFDCGVTRALRGESSNELIPKTAPYGEAFEHFVILETKRFLDYREREAKIGFFRTADGAEVDMILEKGHEIWAIEIKSSSNPSLSDLRGLRSFIRDHKYSRAICVCQTPRIYSSEKINFIPWKQFLSEI
ncbi:ATP-binding protein [Candidatus Margulisiibacteriota bacterium]